MGDSFGLESVLWFANDPKDAYEDPTIKRSRSHEYVSKEVKNVRENVGVIEVANFSKHEFQGPGARKFLNYVLAGRIPKTGRISLNPMLTPKGKLYGDLTVACLNENQFIVFGSGAVQEMHRRWFEKHLKDFNLVYKNRSDDFHGLALSGPKSRDLLQKLVKENISNENFKFRDVKEMYVAGVPAIVNRISFTGELGYEIYVESNHAGPLYDNLTDAGKKFGITQFGVRALVSMGMEKSFGIWSREFTPDYTPVMCGMDRFVDYKKTDFIGREAALADRDAEHEHKLVALEVDSEEGDAWGYEPIWSNGDYAGFVTSGTYGHTVRKSLALGYVKTPYLGVSGYELSVHLVEGQRPARILSEPPYDPTASKMLG